MVTFQQSAEKCHQKIYYYRSLLLISLTSLLPLDLLRRLGHEEADHVGGDLVAARVDGDLGVAALRHLRLDRQQQQLQLHKTQPEIVWM